MTTITLTALQRNPKLISQATDMIEIIDKRKNIVLGVYFPNSESQQNQKDVSFVDKRAGAFSDSVPEELKGVDIKTLKDLAWEKHIQDKYGKK